MDDLELVDELELVQLRLYAVAWKLYIKSHGIVTRPGSKIVFEVLVWIPNAKSHFGGLPSCHRKTCLFNPNTRTLYLKGRRLNVRNINDLEEQIEQKLKVYFRRKEENEKA